jgi:hypothetical protein
VIGSPDHFWHKTITMTPKERAGWDRSLTALGITIAPTGPVVIDRADP